MTNLNDYLSAGKKALQQWRPLPDPQVASIMDAPKRPVNGGVDPNWPPRLQDVLKQPLELPEFSVLLGMGEDRLPFHLDLANPASGAVLICGDPDAGISDLLRSILASSIALNPARQLNLSIITPRVIDYMEFSRASQCQEILPADDEIVSEFIIEVADLVEHRRSGAKHDPAILLFIDNLSECTQYLSEQAYARLYRLIRHGPRYRVWTFATMGVERSDIVDERFLSAFRTRLIGRIKNNRIAAELSQDPGLRAAGLEPGQFFLPYGSQWLRFWTCPAKDALKDTGLAEEESE